MLKWEKKAHNKFNFFRIRVIIMKIRELFRTNEANSPRKNMKCFFSLSQRRAQYDNGTAMEKNSMEFVKKKFLSEKLGQRQNNNNHHHNHCLALGGWKKSQPNDGERKKKNNFLFYFALGATEKRKLSNDVY